jgi:hypothetical protein
MMTRDAFEQRLEEMIQRIDAKDARRAIRGTEFFSIVECPSFSVLRTE